MRRSPVSDGFSRHHLSCSERGRYGRSALSSQTQVRLVLTFSGFKESGVEDRQRCGRARRAKPGAAPRRIIGLRLSPYPSHGEGGWGVDDHGDFGGDWSSVFGMRTPLEVADGMI